MINTYVGFLFIIFPLLFSVTFFNGTSLYANDENKHGSGHELYINADKQFAFAGEYFNKGDYERALSEYNRFIFFFPEDKRVRVCRFNTGVCLKNINQNENAIKIFRDLIKQDEKDNLSQKAYFELSDCYFVMKDFNNSIAALEYAAASTSDQDIKDQAFYRIGWILVENQAWDQAKQYFNKVGIQNIKAYEIDNLINELEKAKNIPQKNPKIAGFLSLVPGGGYLYCTRYKDALTAFILNTGLIIAAAESFSNDSPALGGVISFVEAGFYAGNIYGGINSAHKYNRSSKRNFIENLKKQAKITLSANQKDRGIGLLFESRF
jgi:tetratricopeptide (TPR) repeat protein